MVWNKIPTPDDGLKAACALAPAALSSCVPPSLWSAAGSRPDRLAASPTCTSHSCLRASARAGPVARHFYTSCVQYSVLSLFQASAQISPPRDASADHPSKQPCRVWPSLLALFLYGSLRSLFTICLPILTSAPRRQELYHVRCCFPST